MASYLVGRENEPCRWCGRCRAGGRPQAARRAGLEVVEKLLTSITSGSGLAFGQATSRSSWILLSLTADMRDQGLTQLLLGELILQASDGKPNHVTGRQGRSPKRAWAASRLSHRHCSSVRQIVVRW